VRVAEPEAGVAGGPDGVPDGFSPENPQAGLLDHPDTINGKIAVRAALKAGVLGMFIGIIPVLGMMLTGALAVYFYRRKGRSVRTAVLGARLGAAAGVVVFGINALATIPIIMLHAQQQCVDEIVELARKGGFDTTAPQFQTSIHSLFTPSGLAAFFIFAVVLGSVGGALASLLLRSDKPRI
jgi:hypothetical protein